MRRITSQNRQESKRSMTRTQSTWANGGRKIALDRTSSLGVRCDRNVHKDRRTASAATMAGAAAKVMGKSLG
jgi:hypothetical protein